MLSVPASTMAADIVVMAEPVVEFDRHSYLLVLVGSLACLFTIVKRWSSWRKP